MANNNKALRYPPEQYALDGTHVVLLVSAPSVPPYLQTWPGEGEAMIFSRMISPQQGST